MSTTDNHSPQWFDIDEPTRASVAQLYDKVYLEAWQLSTRTLRGLHRGNYVTIGDVIRASNEIVKVRGIGVGAITELDTKIRLILEQHLSEVTITSESTSSQSTSPNGSQISGIQEVAQKFAKASLQSLSLSKRTYNALRSSNPNMTVGDIIQMGSRLKDIRGLGIKGILEIEDKVKELLFLSDEETEAWLSKLSNTRSEPLGKGDLEILSTLSPASGEFPIQVLLPDISIYKILSNLGIKTIGSLVERYIQDRGNSLNLSDPSIRGIEHHLQKFSRAINSNGTVNWKQYYGGTLDYRLLGAENDSPSSIKETIEKFPLVVKLVLSTKEDDKRWVIIQRRYALDKSDKLTLEELSYVFNVTRERVRQIEDKSLTLLKNSLIDGLLVRDKTRVHPGIIHSVHQFVDIVANNPGNMIAETDLFKLIGNASSLNTDEARSSISLLCDICGIQRIEFDEPNIETIYGVLTKDQLTLVKIILPSIFSLIGRQGAKYLDETDILVNLNKGLARTNRLSVVQFRWLIKGCNTFDVRSDGKVGIKFEHLRGITNQAERILIETGHEMLAKDIVRVINHRTVMKGKRPLNVQYLVNQMVTDDRFVAIGRSGKWALKSWKNVETGTILALMEQCLISLNRTLSLDEIYEYVQERRGVSKTSIQWYLQDSDKFTQITKGTWALSIWDEAKQSNLLSREGVAEFVAKLFKEKKVTELEYIVVKQALVKNAKVNERTAQGMLNFNPVIKTRRGDKNELIAAFQPDYREKLLAPNSNEKRSRNTLRDRITTLAKQLLEAAPGNQMPLADLVIQTQKSCGCPKATAWQYVSQLPFIEKIDLPDGRSKACRLRSSPSHVSYPLAQKLSNHVLRQNVERAISLLDEQYVDVGLFELGKALEATLKAYLVEAKAKGKLKSPLSGEPKDWKFVGMIDCARNNSLITDKSDLHILREDRNDRAHGVTPSLDERRILMKSAPEKAGRYIDYIYLFDKMLNDLKSP